MSNQTKLFQTLGIPFAALVSVLFGLMLLSLPIGAYVVFNSAIENDINFDYPIQALDFFPAGIGFEFPVSFELGDVFIIVWSIFVILFTIAMFGPKKNFLNSILPYMMGREHEHGSNYLITIIKWFSILIVVSAAIGYIQDSFGITTEPPPSNNLLLQFFDVTLAPISEEIGFRVMLIGIPVFALYANKASFSLFFKSLWNPTRALKIRESKKAIVIIVLVGVFFGAAHIFSGEPWSSGKFAQATASGIILGWVYFKHGLLPAILVHWSTNYFIFSYVFFLADINEISIQNAFSHSLINTLEILLVITGILAIAIMVLNYLKLKKKERLEI